MRTFAFVVLSVSLLAAEFPEAAIQNKQVQAKFYLPDPVKGYYQGTRFDWSGVIYSLKFKGHEYFGPWFEKHDPKIHDAITGPVEEFKTNDAGLGYEEAKAGGTFIRIGAGVVRKPEEPRYRAFNTYEIADPGKWKVKQGKDWIEFTHELSDGNGYAYTYRKRISLIKDSPEMVIDHWLKNTGKKTIETSQYNHNFFTIDGEPIGPDVTIKFPFDAKAARDLKGAAKVEDKQLVYAQELVKGQSVFTEITGASSVSDYDIRIENRKAGAGVRIRGDRPISKLVFWSIKTTACPEPYIDLKAEPGQETRWKISYEFYAMK